MAADIGLAEIIHRRALQAPVVQDEAAGLDDVDGDAQTGAEAQQGTDVLRDVRLVEGKAHGAQLVDRSAPWQVRLLSLIHISEPTRQAEISYAVFCLTKKKN